MKTRKCVHQYRPYYPGGEVDFNFRRKGETSHRQGAFFNFTVTFGTCKSYTGKYSKLEGRPVVLDVTTMIHQDWSDADVNNLVFYYDHKRQKCRLALRKQIQLPGTGPITLQQIEDHVEKRQFRAIPVHLGLVRQMGGDFEYFERRYFQLKRRIEKLHSRGWIQDPAQPRVCTDPRVDPRWKAAEKYFLK